MPTDTAAPPTAAATGIAADTRAVPSYVTRETVALSRAGSVSATTTAAPYTGGAVTPVPAAAPAEVAAAQRPPIARSAATGAAGVLLPPARPISNDCTGLNAVAAPPPAATTLAVDIREADALPVVVVVAVGVEPGACRVGVLVLVTAERERIKVDSKYATRAA